MYKQLSLFPECEPGDYIDFNRCGKKLSFANMKKLIGENVIMDDSNAYVSIFRVIQIESVNSAEQLVCYDGTEQRMFVSKNRFMEKYSPFIAYSLS